jgi:Flp pilus assembly protein TadD
MTARRTIPPHGRILNVSARPTTFAKFCILLPTVLIMFVPLTMGLRAQDASAPGGGRAAQADASYRVGITALQQGDLASARTAFEKTVQLQPRSPEAHNSLGWVLMAQKQVDPAIAQFQAALDLRADFFQAHMNLSSAFLLKGDAKRA